MAAMAHYPAVQHRHPFAVSPAQWPANVVYPAYLDALAENNPAWPAPDAATPEYPESAQRTIMSSSPRPSSSSLVDELPLNPFVYKGGMPRSPSNSPQFSSPRLWSEDLTYPLDDDHPDHNSSRHPSAPAVVSPDADDADDPEGCFIMELSTLQKERTNITSQSLAPPTEVPLRATQASKEMRKMMGVFRLNPFAIHSGMGRGGAVNSSWCAGEARPLDEEPLIFEFQLELDNPLFSSPHESLRAFSPDFELHNDMHDDLDPSDWAADPGFVHANPAAWDMDYAPSEGGHFSSSESTSTDYNNNTHSRSHHSLHHDSTSNYSYLGRVSYTNHTLHGYPTAGSASSVEVNHVSPRDDVYDPAAVASWSRHLTTGGYARPERASHYAPGSPTDNNPAVLPSLVSANRRWSLPDSSNLGTSGPFLV